MNPQALLALQLLTRSITDLTLAIQTVMTAGAARSTAPAASASKPIDALVSKFTAAIGPLAVLGAVVQSNISGFQVMGTAVKVLAGTLAPLLLPATVLISTALVALSDVVLSTLMPGMESFFGVMLSIGLPAIIGFVDAMIDGGKKIQEWADALDPKKNETAAVARDLGEFLRDASPLTWSRNSSAVADIADRRLNGAEGGSERQPTEGSRLVMGALRDVMQSLRLSVGPRAQISGLESVGRAAQLAALNNDPLEARMLRTQQQILAIMERTIARTENDRVYDPVGNDFSGDEGAGVSTGGDF